MPNTGWPRRAPPPKPPMPNCGCCSPAAAPKTCAGPRTSSPRPRPNSTPPAAISSTLRPRGAGLGNRKVSRRCRHPPRGGGACSRGRPRPTRQAGGRAAPTGDRGGTRRARVGRGHGGRSGTADQRRHSGGTDRRRDHHASRGTRRNPGAGSHPRCPHRPHAAVADGVDRRTQPLPGGSRTDGRCPRRRSERPLRGNHFLHLAGRRVHAEERPDARRTRQARPSRQDALDNDDGVFKPGMPADAVFGQAASPSEAPPCSTPATSLSATASLEAVRGVSFEVRRVKWSV